MPLIKCRTCGTRFTGFECPDCGRHLSSRGCLVVLIGLVVALAIVSLVFPSPRAPRIEEGSGGDITYIFESFRHSQRAAFRLTLFVLFVAFLVCRIRLPHSAPPTPSTVPGLGGASAMMFGSLGRVLRTALLGLLAVVLVCLVVLKPLGEFRALTVTDKGVRLQTLYHTRHLPFAKIDEAATKPKMEESPRSGRLDLRFIVRTDSRNHQSVRLRLSPKDRNYESAHQTLRAAIADIHRRKDFDLPAEATP